MTTSFRGDKYKVSLQLTAINVTNKYALYNFLSTVQRNTLRHAACTDGGTRIPLLAATPPSMRAVRPKPYCPLFSTTVEAEP